MRTFPVDRGGAYLRFHDLPGTGVPLVFLHGLGCASSCDYPRVAAEPALAGRRLLLVDLLGYGFSDRPTSFGYTVTDHAQSVCELVTGLELGEVDLYGHSKGGAIAIEAAGRLGNRVRHLVVSEPNLDAGGGVFSRPIAEQREEIYVASGHAAAVRSALTEGHLVWAGSLLTSSPLAVYRGARSLVLGGTPSWRDVLARLPIPRAVVFGARSLPDPDTERLPAIGVTVHVVPNAGHSMAQENPAALAGILRRATEGVGS